ncbi:MAG TPA: cyclic pyranopterin monophosphate synthase MoaC [Conexivisphaerales archaeon]|nr:cyclic pyranopterin monophosphate synthase MoaC [Conexivisphaerales archaeon]
MVDISAKPVVRREAVAEGFIELNSGTIRAIREKRLEKGDAEEIAKLGAITAGKRTSEILMLCHPIPIESFEVDVKVEKDGVRVTSHVVALAKTGVEMEALTAVAMGLLNVWDVTKKYEKDAQGQYPSTAIRDIHVVRKVKKQ